MGGENEWACIGATFIGFLLAIFFYIQTQRIEKMK